MGLLTLLPVLAPAPLSIPTHLPPSSPPILSSPHHPLAFLSHTLLPPSLPPLQGTTHKFAMKTLEKKEMHERNKVQRCLTEAHILSTIDHPFLPTCYCMLQSDTHIHFVLNLCEGGELYGLLNAQPKKHLKVRWGGGTRVKGPVCRAP